MKGLEFCTKEGIVCPFATPGEECNEEEAICKEWKKTYNALEGSFDIVEKEALKESIGPCPLKEGQYCPKYKTPKEGIGPCDGTIGDCNLRDKIYSESVKDLGGYLDRYVLLKKRAKDL